MRITLIRSRIGHLHSKEYIDEGRMEPLELAVLAGLIPNDIDVLMYDDRVEKIPFDEHTDLVAITCDIYTAKRSYEIAAEYKKRNIPVIIGGMHASLVPDEVIQYADSVFVGDAENRFHEVIADLKAGKLKQKYQSFTCNPQQGFFPRREIYQGKKYLPINLLQFGRGCPHSCSFCAISRYFGQKHYFRQIDQVLEEVNKCEHKLLFFVDDNITANRKMAKELFQELSKMKIQWFGQAAIDMTEDKELMKLMERSGCIGQVVGFESITPEGLQNYNKSINFNQPSQYAKALTILKDHGIMIWAAMTIGHDAETHDTIKRTMEFTIKNKFAFAAFNILMPYPTTPWYEQLKAENRLLFDGKWWLHPEYTVNHAAFLPKNMSPDELTNHCFDLRKNFNSYLNISRRVMETAVNRKFRSRMFSLLRYGMLFRIEALKKQGLKLGI